MFVIYDFFVNENNWNLLDLIVGYFIIYYGFNVFFVFL